jgi:hypothetical protein
MHRGSGYLQNYLIRLLVSTLSSGDASILKTN